MSQYIPGWEYKPDEVEAIRSMQPMPVFSMTPANAADEIPDHVFLWEADRKVLGKVLEPKNQGQVGSCVSFGTNTAIRRTMLTEIMMGEPEEFKDIVEEVTYGGSRVEVGQGRISGDGSVGAWAAEFVKRWGVVARGTYGGYNLERYDENLCRQFGRSGVPTDIENIAKKQPVKTITQIRSWDEAKKALASGYGIAISSNQGFSMRRDAKGICRPSGSWAHCYPADTWITGPQMKKIQDVAIGDMVNDHEGNEQRVTEVFKRYYNGNLVRISVMSGISTSMTEEHPVMVYRRVRGYVKQMAMAGVVESCNGTEYQSTAGRSYMPAWVRAKDVRPGDFLVTPSCNNADSDSGHPSVVKSSELAWLFGFLIGDGYAAKGHKIGLRVGKSKPWKRAVEAFKLLGLEATVKEHETFVEIRAYNSSLATWFVEQFYDKNKDKVIPDWLLSWDNDSLVEGMIDSDGCRSKGRHYYASVSKSLALQLRHMLIGLGEKVTMRRVPPRANQFANAREQFIIEYTPGGNRGKVRSHGRNILVAVKSVMFIPFSGEVYNLEVENTHTYIADGYATHNCMALDGYVTEGSEYGHIENSWGADSHTGPVGWGEPNTGGFWADSSVIDRMLRQDDSWAFSAVEGFPARKISWLL